LPMSRSALCHPLPLPDPGDECEVPGFADFHACHFWLKSDRSRLKATLTTTVFSKSMGSNARLCGM
jgi:hypothetical protein